MDRYHFASGELDGVCGTNTRKALFDWQTYGPGAALDPLDEQAIDEALLEYGGPALREHVLSADDVSGPFLDRIPVDPEEKAALPYLGFTSRIEKLAERFQTSIRAPQRLNPDRTFSEGEKITVPRLGEPLRIAATDYWLELQTGREVLFLRTEETVIARWPATINPQKTPIARMEIGSRAPDPNYYDLREIDGKQHMFVYKKGPNNPVGTDWLSLVGNHPSNQGIKGFGLHGSPEPSGISKQVSAGCIRMTNWDIEELAGQLDRGIALIPVS
ncbi:L,D-transpeptidase [Hoeflea sp.]|uniref:L,D-transpeptidase n=1 Tax=Hoeflea sp. TaxID=1940281 RepID=UPI003749D140